MKEQMVLSLLPFFSFCPGCTAGDTLNWCVSLLFFISTQVLVVACQSAKSVGITWSRTFYSVWFLNPFILSDLLFVVLVQPNLLHIYWSKLRKSILLPSSFFPLLNQMGIILLFAFRAQKVTFPTWLNWILLRLFRSILLARLEFLIIDYIFFHLAHSSPKSLTLRYQDPQTLWSLYSYQLL